MTAILLFLGFLSYSSNTEGCGATYTTNSGSFNTPNYPSNYPDGQDCTWHIVPSPPLLIHITFVDFELEGGYDFVKVYNSTDGRVASLTGSRSGTVVTSSTVYRVEHRPDPWTNRRGFTATWGIPPSAAVDIATGLHDICNIDQRLELRNVTGLKVKDLESQYMLSHSDCWTTCVLLSACTHYTFQDGLCRMYQFHSGGSVNLNNVWCKL